MGFAATGNKTLPGFDPESHWHETLRDGTRVQVRPIREEYSAAGGAAIELGPLSTVRA
jgi:hypothetical protein